MHRLEWSNGCVVLRVKRLGLDDIISVIEQNRLRWYGHVL